MDIVDGLITIIDYGRIRLKFKEVMDSRGITRNRLATLIGARFEVADRLYAGTLEKLDLDILARVCCVLKCNVSDVLEFEEKNNGNNT